MSKIKLAKLEEYKAPWELDSSGNEIPEEEQQIDAPKLKKYLHGVLSDKERLQTTVATVTAERDEAKTALDTENRKSLDDDGKKAADQKKAIADAKAEGDLKALKLEVALDIENITPAQAKNLAKRLTGLTREELEEDAKQVAADFGVGAKSSESEEEDDETDETPASRPRTPRPKSVSDRNRAPESSLPDVSDRAKLDAVFPRR